VTEPTGCNRSCSNCRWTIGGYRENDMLCPMAPSRHTYEVLRFCDRWEWDHETGDKCQRQSKNDRKAFQLAEVARIRKTLKELPKEAPDA
jgi:hypothetical protein